MVAVGGRAGDVRVGVQIILKHIFHVIAFGAEVESFAMGLVHFGHACYLLSAGVDHVA
jgi:hypothetical protein